MSALEFVCKDRVQLLGLSRTFDVKLFFPLFPEELVTTLSVGSAPDDGNMALMVCSAWFTTSWRELTLLVYHEQKLFHDLWRSICWSITFSG
jgi:hypothetical protein